jgi:ammonium transporter, Amt family
MLTRPPGGMSLRKGATMDLKIALDTVWVLVAGMLVFLMNLGFGLVESGFTRAKNTVNIISKNFIVFAVATVAFLAIGWGIMFGDGNGLFGTQGLFMLSGADNSPATGDAYEGVYSAISWTGVPLLAKFFFQLVFAATAATIVSGVVAERIKYVSFIVFSFVLVALVYPTIGHWVWGGGWLAELGFWDFAGSTVVHSTGAWAALAGVIVLGPRLGKFGKDGKAHAIPGHNMTSAMTGALILWFGWFGFNAGSQMAADPLAISHIVVATAVAAAAGALAATGLAWGILGKPDVGMTINGALGGLVGITAGCAFVGIGSALIIGGIGGAIIVLGVLLLDKVRIDDPVGAIAVHGMGGIFGTLAVGLFAQDVIAPGTTGNGLFFGGGFALLWNQLIGVAAVGAAVFGASLVVWLAIKATIGVRVSEEEEMEGLDIGEHGNRAYPDFVLTETTF